MSSGVATSAVPVHARGGRGSVAEQLSIQIAARRLEHGLCSMTTQHSTAGYDSTWQRSPGMAVPPSTWVSARASTP